MLLVERKSEEISHYYFPYRNFLLTRFQEQTENRASKGSFQIINCLAH